MKTIEQAAKLYSERIWKNQRLYGSVKKYSKEDFEAGVEFAQQWIDVNDELPEEKTWVIAKVFNFYVAAHYNHEYWWDHHGTAKAIHGITHWRPIERK